MVAAGWLRPTGLWTFRQRDNEKISYQLPVLGLLLGSIRAHLFAERCGNQSPSFSANCLAAMLGLLGCLALRLLVFAGGFLLFDVGLV